MIEKEPNLKRRAQRVALPVAVQIEDKTYKAKDFSVIGIGIESNGDRWDIGERVSANLILPFKEASVIIPVDMVCRRVAEGEVGFEFEELTPKKRRAIRQYIEFAIEGRLDDIETVIATLNLPSIDTPIGESLILAEEEEANLYRSFKRHMLFWLVFGGIVISIVLAFIAYNSIFIFKTYGIVHGDRIDISSKEEGVVAKIHTNIGKYVNGGSVLFEIDNPHLLYRLSMIKNQINILEEENKHQYANKDAVIKTLEELYKYQIQEYKKAKKLFDEHVISIKDFRFVEANLIRLKLRLAEAKASAANSPSRKPELAIKISQLKAEMREIEDQIKGLKVVAPTSGWVKQIKLPEGSVVHERDIVIVMEKEPLFVLCHIPNWELTKIAAKEPVKIYSPVTGKTYDGRISVIGYPTQEFGTEGTIVKIDFLKDPGLPVNSRVVVWFKNEVLSRLKSVF